MNVCVEMQRAAWNAGHNLALKFSCVCVCHTLFQRDSIMQAGGWSVPQMSPANEDASVAQ